MIFMQCIVVTELLASYKAVWLPLLTLHENLQNKLTMRSVPDPPVHAGDEKHTSSAARWVWVRD